MLLVNKPSKSRLIKFPIDAGVPIAVFPLYAWTVIVLSTSTFNNEPQGGSFNNEPPCDNITLATSVDEDSPFR